MAHRWTVVVGTAIAGTAIAAMAGLTVPHAFGAPADRDPGPASVSADAGTPETDGHRKERSGTPTTPHSEKVDEAGSEAESGAAPGGSATAPEINDRPGRRAGYADVPPGDTDVDRPEPDGMPNGLNIIEISPSGTPSAGRVQPDGSEWVGPVSGAPPVTTAPEVPRVGDRPAPAAPVTSATAAEETASVPLNESPGRAPSLLNAVGSVIMNLLGGLIQIVDGPPILPAHSTVAVRTSSLAMPIGAGRSVQADWYFPEQVDASTRLIYLQHGFLASAPMYSYTAARLAERTNAIVVAPSLSSNFFTPDAAWVGGSTMHRAVADLFAGERQELTRSASDAAGYAVVLPDRFVLVGHSAGGTLVTSAAGFMADNGAVDDLVGMILLDGVEPAGSPLLRQALDKLRGGSDRPIYLISSERYFWSRGGDMADKIQLARPGRFNGVGLAGGTHIDYMEGGNPIVQFGEYLTAGFSLRRNIDAASAISVGWVNDLFAGTTTHGVYGAPGESIAVATPSGTATATVLPLGQPVRPVWPPLLDAILTAIFDFGGRYLFVYDPLQGYRTSAPTADEFGASTHF